MMRNTWDEEVDAHAPDECWPCRGTRFYKLPVGCGGPGNECEDENNCYCDCHDIGQTPESLRGAAAKIGEAMG